MKVEMIRRSTVNKKAHPTSSALVNLTQIEKVREKKSTIISSEICSFQFQLPILNLLDQDNSTLDSNQWTLLSNLIHSYQDSRLFSMCERIRNEIHSSKIVREASLHHLLTTFYDIAGNSLCSNADITRLPFDDRLILLYTAATNATCLGAHFIYYHSHLIYYELFWHYLEPIYGRTAVNYTKWSSRFTDPDPILCKLSIALYTFSSNTRVFYRNIQSEYTNIKEILDIQNKYAEVTWKYLLYKNGYKDTVRKYLHMIEWFLALTVTMHHGHSIDKHVNDVESLVEKTELTLVLDDVDRIVYDGI